MNFKKWMAGVLGTGLVVSMGVNSMTAYANESNVAGSAESEAEVKFVAPEEGGADVLDPKDMEKPLTDGDGETTGDTGLLSLDYVSNIRFGEQEVSSAAQKYYSITKSPFVQVTDQRGKGAGWALRAETKGFQEVDEEGNIIEASLKGAKITLYDTEAGSPLEWKEGQKPVVDEEIVLGANEGKVNVAVARAKEEGNTIDTAQGVGTWLISWMTEEEKNSKVELYIPARAASVGTHVGTIEWTLDNGPGNSN